MESRNGETGSEAVPAATEEKEARHHFKRTDAELRFTLIAPHSRQSKRNQEANTTQDRV